MKHELNTDELTAVLSGSSPEKLPDVLSENKGSMFSPDKPFSRYLKQLLAAHGKTQISVIEEAGFSEKYGYRLLAELRHTRQRDYILRICIAGTFTLEETNRLLMLYGMAALYARVPRDAVIISCISSGCGIADTDAALARNSFDRLRFCTE